MISNLDHPFSYSKTLAARAKLAFFDVISHKLTAFDGCIQFYLFSGWKCCILLFPSFDGALISGWKRHFIQKQSTKITYIEKKTTKNEQTNKWLQTEATSITLLAKIIRIVSCLKKHGKCVNGIFTSDLFNFFL